MNLAQLAEQDNAFLIEDDVTGFAYSITLTPQVGSPLSIKGDFDRTSMSRDPATGIQFAQAKASITVRSSRLAGFTLDDSVGVTVALGASTVFTGAVGEVLPDTTNGITTILLARVGA